MHMVKKKVLAYLFSLKSQRYENIHNIFTLRCILSFGGFFPPFLFWIQVTETVLSGLSKKEFIVYQMTPMESKTELSNNNSGTIGSWEALKTAAGIGKQQQASVGLLQLSLPQTTQSCLCLCLGF